MGHLSNEVSSLQNCHATRANFFPSLIDRLSNQAPFDYIPPHFPGLYWPFPVHGEQARYLYSAKEVWRFTLLWTLIFYAAVHLAVSAFAVAVQWKNWKIIWIVPVIYIIIGGIEAVIAGSAVGGL